MTELKRDSLKTLFQDGARPSGEHFGHFIDSFVQKSVDARADKSEDGISIDKDGNFAVARGLRLGDSGSDAPGSLRFNATQGQVQFNNGAGWKAVGGGAAGAFLPAGGSATAVAHNGNVGIGDFSSAAPAYKLEVPLGEPALAPIPAGAAQKVRFGNTVCGNGTGSSADLAIFAHWNNATNNSYALAQNQAGEVRINAASGQLLSIRQANAVRMQISTAGNVLVGTQVDNGAAVLQVNGEACKLDGSTGWKTCSDARVKDNVRDFEAGLEQLRLVRPIRFRYNGLAGTIAGTENIGVLGQEIERIFPEMTRRVHGGFDGDAELEDLLIYDGSAMTYVLVNAVKELATKVEQLEHTLAKVQLKLNAADNTH